MQTANASTNFLKNAIAGYKGEHTYRNIEVGPVHLDVLFSGRKSGCLELHSFETILVLQTQTSSSNLRETSEVSS